MAFTLPRHLRKYLKLHKLPKSQMLAELQDEKRLGNLSSEDIRIFLAATLHPTRTDADGRNIGLHKQLPRAIYVDNSTPIWEAKGTPPQRHSWSLAERRNEPIRRGSQEWRAARQSVRRFDAEDEDADDHDVDEDDEDDDEDKEKSFPAVASASGTSSASIKKSGPPTEESSSTVDDSAPDEEDSSDSDDSSSDSDDEYEYYNLVNDISKPGTSWGRIDRGRTWEQRCAARERCKSCQPSSLRLSWSVSSDNDAATLLCDEPEAKIERLEKPACQPTNKLNPLSNDSGGDERAGRPSAPCRVDLTVAMDEPSISGREDEDPTAENGSNRPALQRRDASCGSGVSDRGERDTPELAVSYSDSSDDSDDDEDEGIDASAAE